MKKIKIIILILICSMTLLSGCGNGKQPSDAENISETTKTTDTTETAEPTEIMAASPAEADYGVGDTIVWTNYYGQQIWYTLEDVQCADNLNELGIDKAELTGESSEYITDEGDVSDGEYGANQLLYLTVKVKNIDYQGFSDETQKPYKMVAETLVRTESELEDVDSVPHNGQAVYFSAHSSEEKDYYFYYLEPGQEMEVQLLWVIPEKDFEEPIFYVIGESTGKETYQYFRLN